jgi:hypothetical protein
VVEETTRRVAAAVDSAGSTAAGATQNLAADRSSSPAPRSDAADLRHTAPGGRETAALPSPSRSGLPRHQRSDGAFVAGPHLAGSHEPTFGPRLLVGASGPQESVGSPAPPSDASQAGVASSRGFAPPSPPASAATASSSTVGGGFGPSVLLFALLALLILAAPRTRPRLLQAGRRHRSAPFICALERPG